MPTLFASIPSGRSAARYLRDALVFAPCYLALDWTSYIDPLGPFNITPWNPQPALAIVWMQLAGLHHAPAVLIAILIAEIAVRHAPAGLAITLCTGLALTAGYMGIAWALRSLLRPDAMPRSPRQLALFAAVVVAGAAVVGAAFVGILQAAELLPAQAFTEAFFRFWVGDAVGMLVTAPLLLAVADAERRVGLLKLMRRQELPLQLVVLAATLWLIFRVLGSEPTRYFYLLFLPLIWIAVRGGMNGAVVATLTVQLGVVLGIHQGQAAQVAALDLQALVAALTLTGFFLGVMVDERERSAEGLRRSLHLAAAGEMAGAIAHEVNQPLTALANYGESARMLLARGGDAVTQLPAVIDKMLAEAQRASEVVRRLRDFFRAGTMRLEPVAAESLLAAARRIGQGIIGGRSIAFDVEGDRDLPAVLADKVQLELILRNLLANATESLDALPNIENRISVSASRHDADHIRIVVADTGPGVSVGMRERLFEPFASGKASGMGLGLAVSRAIAEAHGGSLDAAVTGHGEFHLILPTAAVHE